MRFMQSTVVVMPIDPNGPIRALHERIKIERPVVRAAALHVHAASHAQLLSELATRDRELLRIRFDEPAAAAADWISRTQKVLDLPLIGSPSK